MPRPLVAFNPLTWYFTADGRYDATVAPPLPEIYRQLREAGFDAVHVEIPGTMTVAGYRRLLDDSGLAPAPGYFQAPFGERDTIAATTEQARRAAGAHAELGLERIFIADRFGDAGPRLAAPGVGAGFDRDRLDRIIEGLSAAAAAMAAEGVLPCLHPHVGTWIETPEETDAVLAGVSAETLLFGPDTGHLAWAGADPAAFIGRHLDRVGAVHLKDLRHAVRERGQDYERSTSDHLWTEPGRGDVDLAAVLSTLSRFEGWYVVEVDFADQPTPQESAAVSAAWVRKHLGAG
ncbi:inosose dehydratase [Microtetraspora sp. NBRC 13810]|uniref:sugar phosphate isomerase/epimerase family protein n=1 Tax=Microtetraspora sp. NBRC 13810 TaxID=3030990 RepID=UPI0024A42314|nr:sugar phosphate isomerase/epimerase [Microtetraspora sp. NBRC 13810]GLW09174.1 inosose dehydratase [Microtetraspora sp. NBRC 13810]